MCDFKEVKNLLSVKEDGEYFAPPLKEKSQLPSEPIQRARFTFTKRGMLRFCSHLDILKAMQLIFKRSGLRIAYTQGFNPVPKMTFTPPLPMGFGSESELLDVVFTQPYNLQDTLKRLQEIPLQGLEWLAVEEVPLRAPALSLIHI